MSSSMGVCPVKANTSTNVTRKSNQNIQVYLRVRPTNERERIIRSIEMVEVPSPREVIVKQTFESKMSKKFTFDRAFGPESKQADVYQFVVAPLIEEVLSGYNCTVFAYGQTGTGKTHTMVGEEIPTMVSSWEDDSALGIIPRSLSHLFQELRLMGVEFSMRVSYLELYNEELCDLLSPSESTQIRIFDDANKKGSIIVQGLEEIPVHTTGDVYKLLAKGQEKRRMAATLMNAQSSRSHTIFSITVHIRENGIDGEELLKIGKLNLVDLAGSENLSKAGNEKGIRTRETVNINQSLLTLGRVITALVERTPHIPYRESKLTRLLQESLGGRTKTSIIATVSPGHKDLEETLSTLEYAHRAKNIQNRPEVNQKLTKKTVLKEYTEEIDRLKRDLMASRDKNGIYLAEETYTEMTFRIESQNKDLNEKVSLIKALKEDMASKQRIFTEISMSLVEKAAELETAQGRLAVTAEELDQTKSVLRTTKRRYQEKKQILENHVQTEQLLTGQANALIDVVESASTDTYRLHDTIERRRSVDAKIRSATESHARAMDEQLGRFQTLLQQTSQKCQGEAHVQADEFGTNTTQSGKFTTSVLLKMKHLSETGQETSKQLLQSIATNCESMTIASNAQKTELRDKETKLHADLGVYLNSSAEYNDRAKETIVEKKAWYTERLTNMSEMHKSSATDASRFCQQRCTDARALMPTVRQLIERNEQNNAQLRTQIAANDANMREMHAQMQQMFETVQLANATYSVQVDQNSTNMKELLNAIETENGQSIAQTENFARTSAASSVQQTKALDALQTAIDADSDGRLQLIQLQLDGNAAQKAHLSDRLNESLALLERQHTDTVQRIQTLQLEIEQLQSGAVEAASVDCAAIVADIQSESQRQRNSNSVVIAVNDSIQRELLEYGQRVNGHVDECRERIAQFHQSDLQTYRSTGETPAKRDFVYPKQLAQTSPHDRIVRRFWTAQDGSAMDMDCSVTICEGNESAFLDGITEEKSSSFLMQQANPIVRLNGVALTMNTVAEQSSDGSDISGSKDDLGVQKLDQRSPSPSRALSSLPVRLNRSAEKAGLKVNAGAKRLNRSAEDKENVR